MGQGGAAAGKQCQGAEGEHEHTVIIRVHSAYDGVVQEISQNIRDTLGLERVGWWRTHEVWILLAIAEKGASRRV